MSEGIILKQKRTNSRIYTNYMEYLLIIAK